MNSLDFYSNHLDGYLEELMQFTAVETPTGNIKQLDRAAEGWDRQQARRF